MRTATITVNGRVQGVGFRYALHDEAQRLGLRGWVRNRRDGSVEAQVAGDADAIEALIAWAHEGPSTARVDDVDVIESTTDPGDGFEIRATA